MKIEFPKNQYLKDIVVNEKDIALNFAPRKKVALLFISLNDRYWPYLGQVLKDCKQNFLPQHHVDYFVWTDYSLEAKKAQMESLAVLLKQWEDAPPEGKQEKINQIVSVFSSIVRLYEYFYPQKIQEMLAEFAKQGISYKREGLKYWVESTRVLTDTDVLLFYKAAEQIILLSHSDLDSALKGATITDTAPVEWPAPTLMRYHLFLQQQEKLKGYDYIFYMDADMRVVAKVSDEILAEGLTAAEHPMYSLRKEYIPPYEPNIASTAYIQRPGKVVDENGKPRFKPYYYAGGFQGGPASQFIEAMQKMKSNIDKDFDNNYTAIWNDESHWNKYLSEHEPQIVLSPAYIYPDSLIKEYYEKIWGTNYEPKIVTLTKPFSLSAAGGEEIQKFVNQ